MRHLLLAFACMMTVAATTTGCGESTSPRDMGTIPACPNGVDVSGKDRIPCTSRDTVCAFSESPQVTITCSCECGKVWECDQIATTCDAGT